MILYTVMQFYDELYGHLDKKHENPNLDDRGYYEDMSDVPYDEDNESEYGMIPSSAKSDWYRICCQCRDLFETAVKKHQDKWCARTKDDYEVCLIDCIECYVFDTEEEMVSWCNQHKKSNRWYDYIKDDEDLHFEYSYWWYEEEDVCFDCWHTRDETDLQADTIEEILRLIHEREDRKKNNASSPS